MTLPALPVDEDALLSLVLAAQERSAEQLSAAHLREAADRLVEFAKSLGFPLLVPISRDAERLVGAAVLVGGGQVNASTGSTYLAGARVLLVDAVVVQVAAIAGAAHFAERAGAEVVGAAVIDHLGDSGSLGLAVHSLLPS
jgi:hypothetical protein